MPNPSPAWASDLVLAYESRASNQFILFGNVHDKLVVGDAFVNLADYLARTLLVDFDVVLTYDLGTRGLTSVDLRDLVVPEIGFIHVGAHERALVAKGAVAVAAGEVAARIPGERVVGCALVGVRAGSRIPSAVAANAVTAACNGQGRDERERRTADESHRLALSQPAWGRSASP